MIARAANGELADWHGLKSETIESVRAALAPVARIEGPEDRERRVGRFAHYRISRTVPPRSVEVWVPAGDAAVALIELDDPPIEDVDELLDRLGPVELVEHGKRWLSGHLVDELAYPNRGLTVSVATPHADVGVDPPPGGARRIVHVQLYAPMSPEKWRVEIGAVVPLRPFPRR